MLSQKHSFDVTLPSIGPRRGIQDPGHRHLHANQRDPRAKRTTPGPFETYPSPPMSGSPSLSPRPEHDLRGSSSTPGSRSFASSDILRWGVAAEPPANDAADRNSLSGPLPRPFAQDRPTMMSFAPRGPEESLPPISSIHSQHRPDISRTLPQAISQPPHMPMMSSMPGIPSSYPMPGGGTYLESQSYDPSKGQRKTKGHVASACVPCKRAHLRCDAQRPCSRCLGNGKVDACVDVQHKKRGRPRLRDDRDERFDSPKFMQGPEMGMRMPFDVYSLGSSHRSGDPRFPDANGADRGMHSHFSAAPSRYFEPVAYLTLDMDIASASPAIADALGGLEIRGRKLTDILVPGEIDKVRSMRSYLAREQQTREPQYLPPIMGRGNDLMQNLGFSIEDVSRYQMDRQEYLAFIGADGQPKQYPVWFGLAKEESYFFAVLMLNLGAPRHSYATSAPASRDAPLSFQSRSPSASHGLTQQPPTSAPGDPRPRLGDSQMQSIPQPQSLGQGPLRRDSPGMSSRAPSHSPALSAAAEYTTSPRYPAPRSVSMGPRPLGQAPIQLPPIRATQGPVADNTRPGDRPGRLDIGGLLDQPAGPGRPQ